MAEDWTGINTNRDLELLQGRSSAQIYVGAENQCWILPLDLLCHASNFFKAALMGGFQEGKKKQVTLREEDPSVFKLFVLWLYKGQIVKSQTAKPVDMVIVKAWIRGDKLGAPGFQNYIMKELLADDSNQDLLIDTEAIVYIYDNTTPTRPYAHFHRVNKLGRLPAAVYTQVLRTSQTTLETPRPAYIYRFRIIVADCWNGLGTEENLQLINGTSCIQVYVGSGDDCWALHTGLVCHLSSFFKAALGGGFKEADEKRVTLKEDDPNVFRLFVGWLYTGAINPPDPLGNILELAWILGDKLGAPAFQDFAMMILVGVSGHLLYHPEIVEHIYSNTAEGSRLRALAVDSVVYFYRHVGHAKTEWMELFSRGGDLVVDLMQAFLVWEDVEHPAVVRAKYLLNPRAILPLVGPTRAGTLVKESYGHPSVKLP